MASTKIIATIGPASLKKDVLKKMYGNGLSTLRINTAHVDPGYIRNVRKFVADLNLELHKHVGVMVDLKGPELRTGVFPGGSLRVETGKIYKVTVDNKGALSFSHPEIYKSLAEGDIIILSDGKVRMKVDSMGKDHMALMSMDDGVLRDRSRVNVPGKFLPLGTVTERDMIFIREGLEAGIDLFAQSFVQRKEDVQNLQDLILREGGDQFIVSKIETKTGFQNIREISRVSDFIMVARGDLGVELPLKEVAIAQKKIIEESHKHGVPTIVATQMLESMVKSSSPTRAEVSDVTNAILDNADALMLSEESSIGDFPDLAVKYLNDIAEFVESKNMDLTEPGDFLGNHVAFSIARAAKLVAREIDADAILAFTKSGNTAKMISAVRPGIPIMAAVTSERTANKLNLYRGVDPVVLDAENIEGLDLNGALSVFEQRSSLRKGSRVVITSGAPYFTFGGTNEVRVATVGNFMGRGYPYGKSVKGTVALKSGEPGDILICSRADLPENPDYGHLKAVIFTTYISHSLRESIKEKGLTVVHNTKLVRELVTGETIHIDGATGVIIS
ncbi:MAG: pyruvate kinase [Candidatus Thermoplasmatota archaeon]|nr:pyruvate kinase [Candidatus Thermoplasmatota archaeon]